MMSYRIATLFALGLLAFKGADAKCPAQCGRVCCPVGYRFRDYVCVNDDTSDSCRMPEACGAPNDMVAYNNAPRACRSDELVQTGMTMMTRDDSVSSASRNVPVVETFILNGVRVWNELRERALPGKRAALTNVPALFTQRDLFYSLSVPLAIRVPGNSEYNFRCGTEPCEVIVFLYECHPCESDKGGLPGMLLQQGFTRTRCAPTFTNGQTDTNHQLIAYSKIIDVRTTGQMYEFTFSWPRAVEFLMAAFSESPVVDCSLRSTRGACEDPTDRCRWRGDRCLRNTCIYPGPGTGCNLNTCLKRELM